MYKTQDKAWVKLGYLSSFNKHDLQKKITCVHPETFFKICQGKLFLV